MKNGAILFFLLSFAWLRARPAQSQLVLQDGFESGSFATWDLAWTAARATINSDPANVRSGLHSAKLYYGICGEYSPTPWTLSLSTTSGGTGLPARTYYVVVTFVNASTETWPSDVVTKKVPAGTRLVVDSPNSVAGYTGYNVYVTTGTWYKLQFQARQSDPSVEFGRSWTEPATGLAEGQPPPGASTGCGLWHQDTNISLQKAFNASNGFPDGLNPHIFIRGYFKSHVNPGGSAGVSRKRFYLNPATPNTWHAVMGGGGGASGPGFSMTFSDSTGTARVELDSNADRSNVPCWPSYVGSCSSVLYVYKPDVWYYVEWEMKLNTPGLSDGESRVWIQQVIGSNPDPVPIKILEAVSANIRHDDTKGLRYFHVGQQADRSHYVPVDEDRWWDDIALSTVSYIGPVPANAPDTTPPAIYNLIPGAEGVSAVVSWNTDELSDGQLEYGPTTNYGISTPLNSVWTVNHSFTLAGLTPGAAYHFRARSRDVAGNLATTGDGVFVTGSGTAALYSFDEGSGATALDSSGNGNAATLSGTGISWTTGHSGQALSMDGTYGYAIRNPLGHFLGTEATVEFWVRSADTAKAGAMISYATPASDNMFLVYDPRSLSVLVNGAGVNSGLALNDGSWHHVAVVWKSSTGQIQIFKDGNPAYSDTAAQGATIGADGSLVIGQEQDSVGGGFDINQALSGAIDEIRLYSRALSQSEIQSDMNAPIAKSGDSLAPARPRGLRTR